MKNMKAKIMDLELKDKAVNGAKIGAKKARNFIVDRIGEIITAIIFGSSVVICGQLICFMHRANKWLKTRT